MSGTVRYEMKMIKSLTPKMDDTSQPSPISRYLLSSSQSSTFFLTIFVFVTKPKNYIPFSFINALHHDLPRREANL
jgi:hypothetical protein